MPRAPLSLSNCSGRRASVSGSHNESPNGATSSPGMSSRNNDGRESGNGQDTDGEGELQEVECGDVDKESRQNMRLSVGQSDRIQLTVEGKEFEPAFAMVKAREIIHCHYKGPWIHFSEVPTGDRRIWFLEFKKKFWWDESIQEAVVAIWKMKAGEHLRTIFICKSAEVQKSDLLQSDGEFHTFREDVNHQVSTLKTELSNVNEQLSTMTNLVQNMAVQLQSFATYPSQFQFPAMQAQFRCNPTPIQGSFTTNEVPTTFTNLLNSNFMFGSLDTSLHPPGPLMASNLNIPNDSRGGSSSMNTNSHASKSGSFGG